MHKEVNIDVGGGMPGRKTREDGIREKSILHRKEAGFCGEREKFPDSIVSKNFKDHRYLIYSI